MKPAPENNEQRLERLIGQTLRDLPVRRAPRSLEARVQTAIAAQAARPWWKKGFTNWPLAARGAFLIVSAGVVKAVLMTVVWVLAEFDSAPFTAAFAGPLDWWHTATTVGNALTDFGAAVFRSIPTLWLYSAAIIVATAYAAFLGLGAAAYRTLCAPEHG